jgi:hypothetical protein
MKISTTIKVQLNLDLLTKPTTHKTKLFFHKNTPKINTNFKRLAANTAQRPSHQTTQAIKLE